jgi:hypothetical protein
MIKGFIPSRTSYVRGLTLITALILVLNYGSAVALSTDQQQLYSQGINYFDEVGGSSSDSCTTAPASANPNGPVATTQAEAQNAKTVMGIAKTEGLGEAGALVALMAALDESQLQIYANSNVPISESNPAKQADGNNGDSVGIFQQQPQYDWSTYATGAAALSDQNAVWQEMDPAYSTEAFFGSPSGATLPSGLVNPGALTKGLQNVSNWQSLAPQVAAQQVQNPGPIPPNAGDINYQNAVATEETKAQSLLSQYWNSAPAVPLPIPFSGGQAAGGGSTTGTSTSCSTSCTSSDPTVTANLSQVRQSVVCIAEQELQLWKSGQLTPGTQAYFKYSQNRAEEWCADFASWVYNQAGDPFGPADSPSNSWSISYVPDFLAPPQDTSKFTYHAIGSGYTPQPGDLAIHGSQHVNIVISVSGGTLTLIGGDQEPFSGSSFPTNIVSEYSEVDPASDDPPITGYVSPNN